MPPPMESLFDGYILELAIGNDPKNPSFVVQIWINFFIYFLCHGKGKSIEREKSGHKEKMNPLDVID